MNDGRLTPDEVGELSLLLNTANLTHDESRRMVGLKDGIPAEHLRGMIAGQVPSSIIRADELKPGHIFSRDQHPDERLTVVRVEPSHIPAINPKVTVSAVWAAERTLPFHISSDHEVTIHNRLLA
jgi:hypothetical protein